jgi:integrase
MVVDRWHKTRPQPDEPRCREHDLAPTDVHGRGKRWQVRWRDDAGRQRKRNHDRKADAERTIAGIKADLARGQYIDPHAGKVTLRSYGSQWLHAQTFDEATREATERRLRLHVYPELGDREIRSLRPSTVQAWTRGLSRTLTPSYVRVIAGNLSTVLTAAVDDGLIARNPCRASSVRPPMPPRRKVQPWPSEWVAGMLAELPGRYAAMAHVAAGLGLRQSEVFGLAVDDIDFLRRVVHVRRQVKIVASRQMFASPKGSRDRDVPLPGSVAMHLAAHIEAYRPVWVTRPWKVPTGEPAVARLVFTGRGGGALNSSYFDRNIWASARRRAGIPHSRENGMHALRHYAASVWLDAGVSIKAVAEYLGHSDPGFTLRTYTHLMPASDGRMRDAVDAALESLFSEGGALNVPSVDG